MSNVVKALLNAFRLPAVFPEEEEGQRGSRLRALGEEMKLRAEQVYEGRKAHARLAW